jgi:spermidine synthase
VLNAIVFICGACLMGLELVAARVLAPALGNSIYVWGSVISTVMVALSLGYWLGGQIADRWGAPRAFGPVIAGAGLFTVAAPLVAGATLSWAADLGPRAGSLAASALIFFVPALLLAMVSPLGVSLAAGKGLARIGRSAGNLYAVSTAGSIVGTLGTAFWLIPLLSIEPLIIGTGFVLLGTAVVASVLPRLYGLRATGTDSDPDTDADGPARSARNGRLANAATALLVVAGFLLGGSLLVRGAPDTVAVAAGEQVLFRKDTQYHRITVTEDATTRHLRFDRSDQSAVDLKDGFTSRIKYPDYLHLPMALDPAAKKVLVLGLGGGMITKRYWRDYPGVKVDSVEIDPVVVDVAKRYFGLPEDDRLRTFTQDARRYVQTTKETYDVIIVDAYYDDALPFHLTTEEFLREMKSRLNPGGVIGYNVISPVEGDKSQLFRSMYRTASGVWDHIWVFPIGLGDSGVTEQNRNIVVLATDSDVPQAEMLARIKGRIGGRVTIDGYDAFGKDLYTGIVEVADVPKLTDSHAPVDSLIQVNR